MYKPQLVRQTLKRAHRQGNRNEVIYDVIAAGIEIALATNLIQELQYRNAIPLSGGLEPGSSKPTQQPLR